MNGIVEEQEGEGMGAQKEAAIKGTSRSEEEAYLKRTLEVVKTNVKNYEDDVAKMQEEIDEMLDHYHDNDAEVYTLLSNTITMRDNMAHALHRNQKALKKPYFGRIVFYDESFRREESLYIGRGGIARDATHQMVVDWRAPVATAYYENGLGKCSYLAPEGRELPIDLKLKRTYEIEGAKLLDYFDTEVIANDELLTKYLAKNKQAVLGEIIATIQKEQNEVIRKSPFHNMIVQGVAGSGKTTVAMHRISYILYNYAQRFKPDDFYIVGSNRILLEYITGVLPDLDVYGIRQMTMEQLFVRLLYEDWDEKRYKVRENVQGNRHTGAQGSIRGTGFWFHELETFCAALEKEAVPEKSIFLNPRQFVEGIRDGVAGVFDDTLMDMGEESAGDRMKGAARGALQDRSTDKDRKIEILSGESIADFLRQNPALSIQAKINLLNERLLIKIKDEFLKSGIRYTEKEQKAILKAYRGRFGKRVWKRSIYDMYRDFLRKQQEKGYNVETAEQEFDVYDLAALAYLYKRVKETEVISEAHHVVIDEAQDFGMMAYGALNFCIKDCTYTVMGDVSQNIHFGYGLNDWEELKELLLENGSGFEVLKKSYRNTVEISEFAIKILEHGSFSSYPSEPIIRHGNPVQVKEVTNGLIEETARQCKSWLEKGYGTIAVICRSIQDAGKKARQLSKMLPVSDSSLEKAVFSEGVMVLPVSYTKGLEFDAVLILDPDREDYPVDDGHARLLYVAATRALHELCVLHEGNLTGLIADPVPEIKKESVRKKISIIEKRPTRIPTVREKTPEKAKPATQKPFAGYQPSASSKSSAVLKPSGSGKVSAGSEPSTRRKASAVLKDSKNVKPVVRTEPAKSPARAAKVGVPEIVREDWRDKFYQSSLTNTASRVRRPQTGPVFADMPSTEKLRPMGHSRIDLSVKWIRKEKNSLYLQSRYGMLRLCPVEEEIVRVTFARQGMEGRLSEENSVFGKRESFWMYKESGACVELLTDALCLQVEKATGAIKYKNRDKKLLLTEKSDSRQIDTGKDGKERSWLFLDIKKEHFYTPGMNGRGGLALDGSARYISSGKEKGQMPFLLSERGYGILVATDEPVIFCNLPAYGSWLCVEGEGFMDFYFMVGKSRENSVKLKFHTS